MKRIFIFFLLICSLAFGGNITNVQNKGDKIAISLTSFDKSQYQLSYDTYNRLIFLEFPQSAMSKKLNPNSFKSKYVESFETVNYGNGTGFLSNLIKIYHIVVVLIQKNSYFLLMIKILKAVYYNYRSWTWRKRPWSYRI